MTPAKLRGAAGYVGCAGRSQPKHADLAKARRAASEDDSLEKRWHTEQRSSSGSSSRQCGADGCICSGLGITAANCLDCILTLVLGLD